MARGRGHAQREAAVLALEQVWPEQVERLANEMKRRDPEFARWLEERLIVMRLREL